MPTYSFGADSPIKFEISDRLADNFNKAAEKFFKAQQRFNQKFGRRWDSSADPILIDWTRQERNAWNEFAKIFNKTIAAFDQGQGHYHPNDIMDDYLIKNVSEAAVAGVTRNRAITWAVAAGVLYVLLKRRQ